MTRNRCDWAAHLENKGILEAVREHVVARGRNSFDALRTEFTGEAWPFEEGDYSDIMTGDRVVDWLSQQVGQKRPWCCFASFCCPHAPYDPPLRYLEQIPYEEIDDFVGEGADLPLEKKRQLWHLRRAYKAMLRLVDDQVGRILAVLEDNSILDDTLIVFTTDHGEALGDRGHFQKARPFWQASTVPTAIRHPRHLDARRCASTIELTDLTATILEVAGIDPSGGLSYDWPAFNNIIPCRSLIPIISGESDRIRDFAFAECCGLGLWHMIQSDEWKYIRRSSDTSETASESLFDLRTDPAELHDVASRHPAVLDQQRRRLLHVLASTPAAQACWAPLMT